MLSPSSNTSCDVTQRTSTHYSTTLWGCGGQPRIILKTTHCLSDAIGIKQDHLILPLTWLQFFNLALQQPLCFSFIEWNLQYCSNHHTAVVVLKCNNGWRVIYHCFTHHIVALLQWMEDGPLGQLSALARRPVEEEHNSVCVTVTILSPLMEAYPVSETHYRHKHAMRMSAPTLTMLRHSMRHCMR